MNTPSFTNRVLADLPDWANTPIQPWDAVRFRQASDFATHHYWTSQGSINVFRIVGTDHPQYAGMTWLDLLHRGKRMDINIPLIEKHPAYYTDAEKQHAGMSFVSLDGIHWFVSADGNHRSCLARFYFHLQGQGLTQLHNVSQSVYRIDDAFMSACQDMTRLMPELARQGVHMTLNTRRLPVSREDTPGWKVDMFRTEAELMLDDGADNANLATLTLHTAQEARQQSDRLEAMLSEKIRSTRSTKPWWQRFMKRAGDHNE